MTMPISLKLEIVPLFKFAFSFNTVNKNNIFFGYFFVQFISNTSISNAFALCLLTSTHFFFKSTHTNFNVIYIGKSSHDPYVDIPYSTFSFLIQKVERHLSKDVNSENNFRTLI